MKNKTSTKLDTLKDIFSAFSGTKKYSHGLFRTVSERKYTLIWDEYWVLDIP
jgi:hypothetical protein